MGDKIRRVRVHVTLPDDVVEAVDDLVGRGGRSQFIAETVAAELRRRRLQAVLTEMAESPPSSDGNAWDDWESSAAWVRAQRRGEPPFRVGIAIDDYTP
ncbi:MAG: ribbon-helix-helix domain-containing protein [Thermomicrobiales bacterium]